MLADDLKTANNMKQRFDRLTQQFDGLLTYKTLNLATDHVGLIPVPTHTQAALVTVMRDGLATEIAALRVEAIKIGLVL